MEGKELNLNKDPGGGYNNSKSGGDGFIDRSKVKILLCDNDSKSSEEVFTLLLKCSYQVISVKSARQVIDALNAEGPDIDIILAEVDLPKAKGMKMLKYITRDKDLRRIPVIMMSTQDEVSIVVKCLRLGAADYLVKPLRTNELLNLWTHMWRRRHMLGLTEKNILNYDLDVVVSDPSDANTNSTTLLSDDTDDKSRRATNPEIGISTNLEEELVNGMVTVAAEPLVIDLSECRPNVPGISDRRTGQLSCGPKKSELKIGESSAFFTYVKASTIKKNSIQVQDNGPTKDHSRIESTQHHSSKQQAANDSEQQQQLQENPEAWDIYSQGEDLPSSSSLPDSLSMERSCTPPPTEEKFTPGPTATSMHPPTGRTQPAYPFHMPGVMNPLMVPPQYSHHHLHHYPHGITQMTHFPFYPPMLQQPSQMPNNHHPHHPHNLWPSFGSSSSGEVKVNKVDRREAALMKFRQKRKERCFDKKIRYVNRKRLAERRPRVRGQFVRKVNGVNVDLNGQPASADEEDEDNDEESRG